MKHSGLLTILICLCSFCLIKAQEFPKDLFLQPQDVTQVDPSSRSDELTVYVDYQLAVCPDSCDAEAAAVAEGGQPPYYYAWSNGATTPEIYNQCVGLGSITVTDEVGNSATAEYVIEKYPVPHLIIDSPYYAISQPSGGQNNGSIALDSSFVIDPSGLYLDSAWSIDGINFTYYHIFPHLGPGVYHLYVRTVQGCAILASDDIILYDITGTEELTASFNLYPSPVINMLQLSADIPLKAELMDMQGRRLFVSGSKTFHQIFMRDYADGIYVVRISDGEKVSCRKIIKTEK